MYLSWFCCLVCFCAQELTCPTASTGPMAGTRGANGNWTLSAPQRSGWGFNVNWLQLCSFVFFFNLTDSDLKMCASSSQISEEIKLCEAGECSYLRPQKRNVLRNILVRGLNLILSSAEIM